MKVIFWDYDRHEIDSSTIPDITKIFYAAHNSVELSATSPGQKNLLEQMILDNGYEILSDYSRDYTDGSQEQVTCYQPKDPSILKRLLGYTRPTTQNVAVTCRI